MAKVQEVQRIPVVKVLDSSPTSRRISSFPPRLLILPCWGTAFALSLATTGCSGKTSLGSDDSDRSAESFAQEVFQAH